MEFAEVSTDCPDISGRYCASGSQWQKGSTELTRAYLPYYLGVSPSVAQTADQVDIDIGSGGTLILTLRAGDDELAKAAIKDTELVCGADRIALQMDAIPWGGSGMVFTLGASSGWRLFRRDADGSLRVEDQRHETGSAFLIVPLYIDNSSWLRFAPHGDTPCN